jgi:hypothetical protein
VPDEALCVVCGESFRLYSCQRCHAQVRLCVKCDHGNLYCPPCAERVPVLNHRRASARYQLTPRGARAHAARQKAYRERKAQPGQKVTDEGCSKTGPPRTVPALIGSIAVSHDVSSAYAPSRALPVRDALESLRCDFCHALLPKCARLEVRRGWGFG